MLLITSSAGSYCLLALGVLKQIAALTVLGNPCLQCTNVSSSQCCCIRAKCSHCSSQAEQIKYCQKNGMSTRHFSNLSSFQMSFVPSLTCVCSSVTWAHFQQVWWKLRMCYVIFFLSNVYYLGCIFSLQTAPHSSSFMYVIGTPPTVFHLK